MFGLGMLELVVIFLVILLLFGAKNIPEIAKGLGKGLKEFKKSLKNTEDEACSNKGDQPQDKNIKDV
jgi:sec-independent protein translocase protein TatA